jgi:S-adenosylmethionine-diacylgycerolhomoserine-N-methlytransferase
MGFFSRLRTLGIATFTSKGGATHEERLNAYYRHQADSYDEFREHLLHGRRELLEQLPIERGTRIVELGAGTGWNAEALGERLALCESYTMVDLCEPLMDQARQRCARHGWSNVHIVHADASQYLPDAPVDIVLCSYVLTMMPRWFAVIDRAREMLRPGGVIAVADFYVSAQDPDPQLARHRAWQRWFWPACFGWHHVYLNQDHLPYLRHRFATRYLRETTGRMPFMAGLRAPYYVFLGCKSDGGTADR